MAKREYIWATVDWQRVPLTAGAFVMDAIVDVVTPTDWARDATSTSTREKGAVLQRIVGDIWFAVDTSGGVASLRNFTRGELVHGFQKRDIDDTSVVDLQVDGFQEDWLQLHKECITTGFDPTPTLTWWGGELQVHRQVDVKVKRKLTSDDLIRLYAVAEATAGLSNAVTTSGMLRALIALP